jgi:hypothetical protein
VRGAAAEPGVARLGAPAPRLARGHRPGRTFSLGDGLGYERCRVGLMLTEKLPPPSVTVITVR